MANKIKQIFNFEVIPKGTENPNEIISFYCLTEDGNIFKFQNNKFEEVLDFSEDTLSNYNPKIMNAIRNMLLLNNKKMYIDEIIKELKENHELNFTKQTIRKYLKSMKNYGEIDSTRKGTVGGKELFFTSKLSKGVLKHLLD